jgi:hypothetical protein
MSRTPKQMLHDKALHYARVILNAKGHKIKLMPETNSSFDLLIDDILRLEVKAAKSPQLPPSARRRGQPASWRFNLHRHGVVPDNQADLYWFYIAGIPGFKAGVSLIIPHSEVEGLLTISISLRSLLTRWSKWYMRTDLFTRQSKTEVSE